MLQVKYLPKMLHVHTLSDMTIVDITFSFTPQSAGLRDSNYVRDIQVREKLRPVIFSIDFGLQKSPSENEMLA